LCAICEGPSFFDCFHRRFYFAPNGERFKSKLAVQGYLEGRSTDLDKNSRETNSKPEPLTEPKVRLPESVTLGVLEGGSKGLDKNSSDINAKQLTTEVTVQSSASETVPQNRYKNRDDQDQIYANKKARTRSLGIVREHRSPGEEEGAKYPRSDRKKCSESEEHKSGLVKVSN